jgi:hypothetical protein
MKVIIKYREGKNFSKQNKEFTKTRKMYGGKIEDK